MNIIRNRIAIIILLLMIFAASGLYIAKNIYNNRVPKSAKLVLHLENNGQKLGKNIIVTSNKGGMLL